METSKRHQSPSMFRTPIMASNFVITETLCVIYGMQRSIVIAHHGRPGTEVNIIPLHVFAHGI